MIINDLAAKLAQRNILIFKKWWFCSAIQHSRSPNDYKQNGCMTNVEIAFSVRKTKRLAKEYEKIIDEYSEKSYILDNLLNLEVGIETQTEQAVNDMT